MMSGKKTRLLVTGASGRLGRKVLDRLAKNSDYKISAASRSPERLASYQQFGIDTRFADFNDPTTLAPAFENIDRLLLISTNDLHSGKRREQHRNAIDAAVAAGVKHIIYTSMPDPTRSAAIPFAADHVATENALRGSGIGYTILRIAWYAENPIELGLVHAISRTGKWFSSAGDGKIAYISRSDVARVAAAALATQDTDQHTYDVTGPRAETVEELADSLQRVVNLPVNVRHVSDDDLAQELCRSGVPAAFVPMLVTTDANTRAGRFATVSDTVQQFTGTPPLSFQEFFRENKALVLG